MIAVRADRAGIAATGGIAVTAGIAGIVRPAARVKTQT
jgi:hypothetical protein